MKKYRLIIFDLDGTLVDTAPDIASCTNKVLRQFGYEERSMDQIKNAIGHGVHDLLRDALKETQFEDNQLELMVNAFRETYQAHLVDESRPYPGVYKMLTGPLKGFSKAVVSNKPHHLLIEILEKLDLNQFFEPAIGTGAGYKPKPETEGVLQATKQNGVLASETIFIGDSCVDEKTCLTAGMDFGWVTYGYEYKEVKKYDYIFNNATEWGVLANGYV